MAEDSKAAKTRRLAEALRANLRRRKAAAAKAAGRTVESDEAPAAAADGGSRG